MAYLREVIICDVRRGSGDDHDPIRPVVQFWTKDGELLGEVDQLSPQYKYDGTWIAPAWMKIKVGALEH
jgi:hypothetical protein